MSQIGVVLLSVALAGSSGCTWLSYLGTDYTGRENGKTFFVGGAGPVGNVVGTLDVPRGLRAAHYKGAIEVFGWQSVVGGTVRDQVDRSRNEEQARRLARRIQDYMAQYPGRRVNVIALSAGTGIATWALESLPDDCRIGTVVFLASSLSRQYDLSAALRRIDGRLYCFYSTRDRVLRYGVPIAGSVDRETGWPNAAGLTGFALPAGATDETRQLYRARVRNRPYRSAYKRLGYSGGHTDVTSRRFIAKVVAPLLFEPLSPPGQPPAEPVFRPPPTAAEPDAPAAPSRTPADGRPEETRQPAPPPRRPPS